MSEHVSHSFSLHGSPFDRFGLAAMTGQGIILVIAAYFFARDRRHNWPYLLAAGSFLVAEALKVWLTQAGLIDPLTRFTGELSKGWVFAVGFLLLLAILGAARTPEIRRRCSHKL